VARDIRIAAALIQDDAGRLLLVRKSGTRWFMQAGGKVEPGENPLSALRRELREEIGLDVAAAAFTPIGTFSARAANEPDHEVRADLFHLRTDHVPAIGSEIAEAVWVDVDAASALPLAPLTRDHVLPLARNYETQSPRL
jgi:8-oxo-dGTP pyrophosphatase MutT (NUDIX family)